VGDELQRRFFLVKLADAHEVGLYSIGVRIASAVVLLLTAFRTAWPAFAYSIEDDAEARRTYGFVLTYLIAVVSWLSLTLGLLAPWIVRLLTTPSFYDGERVVAPLAFAGAAQAGVRGRRNRHRAREADAVQLGRDRRRGSAQRRPQPDPDPAVRDDGRSHRDRRRVLVDVPADGRVRTAHLCNAVSMAPRRNRPRGRDRVAGGGQVARRAASARDRALCRLPPRAAPARLLSCPRSARACVRLLPSS
jgi:hypothetical protein